MTTAIAFPGQPGAPFDDPADATTLGLSDAFKALSLAALVIGTDEEDRIDAYLAEVDVIAFGFPEWSAEAQILSQGIRVVREAAEVTA